ncbi:MAG: formamidopyrimidine-DNA glycosylase [Firmicutes bacterium]|nr:formamidopyrimidine-DNA glycosylase [Bacillota bacterium]
MPELPDLEVFKTNIPARLTSKRLAGLQVFSMNKVSRPQSVLQSELIGRELVGVGRFGKELLFDFGDMRVLAAHLMLNGQISIVPVKDAAKIKYRILTLEFENETLVFSDPGGLCTIKYKPAASKAPDAFGAGFTPDYFLKAAGRNPMTNVKAFLIDQSVVRGIGNAYADEILWAARVSPNSLVGRIPAEVMAALHAAIGSVLRSAVESIKAVSPDIISGEERSFLKVHNKALKVTETGFPIRTDRIVSKTTYYTEEQKLY